MTREEAIHHLYTFSTTMGSGQTSDEQHEEAKRMAIQALRNSSEKPNGSDLISRQDAIDAIRKAYFDKDIQLAKDDPCIVDAMTDWAIRQIKALPSADRPTGEWIPVSEALPSKGQVVLDIDDKETWGDKGTWDVDKQRGW